MNFRAIKYSITIIAVSLLSACFDSTVDVTARFSEGGNLQTGTSVSFNGVIIGELSEIRIEDGSVMADLSLDADAAKSVQSNAVAVINEESSRIDISNPSVSADAVADGAHIEGLSTAMERANWQVGSTVEAVSKAMAQAAKSMNDYFASAQWQQSRKQMESLMDSIEKEASAASKQIQEDYREFLDAIESDAKSAVNSAEKSLRKLQDHLQELQQQGEQQASKFLQQLLDHLQQVLDQKNATLVSA